MPIPRGALQQLRSKDEEDNDEEEEEEDGEDEEDKKDEEDRSGTKSSNEDDDDDDDDRSLDASPMQVEEDREAPLYDEDIQAPHDMAMQDKAIGDEVEEIQHNRNIRGIVRHQIQHIVDPMRQVEGYQEERLVWDIE